MKKRILSMIIAIVMVVGLVPGFSITASAAAGVYAKGTLGSTNGTAWTIYTDGLLVIDGKSNSIAQRWDSTTNSPWNNYADNITRVSFVNCENWEWIPECTFRSLSKLKDVTLPENIKEICQYAFTGTAIETIILPKELKTIGYYAFSSCESLNYININDGVTSIGSGAFYNCSSLKAISIPDSVTSIGQNLFQNCTNLEYVRLSEKADEVGYRMFSGCTMLKNVSLPASVTEISNNVFSNASNLAGVYYHGSNEPTTYNPGLNGATFSSAPDTMVIYVSNAYSGTTMGLKKSWENDLQNVTKIDGYFVNIAHTIGGAVKVDKSIVPVGETVTVDIMAYKNYVLETFAVKGADGKEITVTGDANTRTFAMPAGDVTITATFKSTIVPHVHSWKFEVDGTSINATCVNTDVACHNPYQSVVMTPPSLKYFDWSRERTVKVSGTIEDVEIPEVVYTLKSTGEAARPFAPGVYVASLTIEGVTATCEYEITKSNHLNYTFFTYTAPENLTYDGTAKIATVVPISNVDAYIGDVEVLYNGSTTPPVKVGSYTVTLNVEESDYFTAETNLSLGGRGGQQFSIVAKDIEDLTYTGLAESYPAGATPDVTIKYGAMTLVKGTDYTVEYANNTASGTATMTITGTGNYTGTKTLEFKISAHEHNWTYTANGNTITAECGTADCPVDSETLTISAPQHSKYGDGKDANATLSATKIGDITVSDTDIIYTKGDESLTSAPTDVGTYKASITVDTNKTASVEYTIAKADATAPTGLTAVYGQKLSDVTLPTGWSWETETSVGDVGERTHYANFAGTDNYEAASNVAVTVTVTQSGANMTATANKNSYTYGEDITVTVNITPTAAAPVLLMAEPIANQVAIFNGSTQITEPQTVAGQPMTFTVTGLDVGTYTLTAKYTAGNMEGKTADTQAFTITKATPTITAAPTAGNIIYGQKLEASTLTGGAASVDGTFAWADANTVPTVSGGSTGYEVTFTPTDSANYNTVTVTVALTVAPKDITNASVGAFAAMTYNGMAQTPAATVTIDGLTAGGSWSEVTNVTDTTTFTASGNFTGTIENQNPGMQKLALTGATITLEDDSLIYNGSAQSVTITSVKVGDVTVPAGAYSLSNNTGTEVGSYTLTITANEDSNFTGSATKDFTISKSGSVIGDGSIKTYKGEIETTAFTYGDTISVKAQVAPTGSAAPVTFALTAPSTNQMALFYNGTQISEAVYAVNGVYTMTYSTTDKVVPVGTGITLTAKYVGNTNMGDTEKNVTVSLAAKPLTVVSAGAVGRDYEKNNTSVEITSVTISGKALDSDDVSVDTTNLTGTLASDNAGTYTKVTLPDLTLTGEHQSYYVISGGEVDTDVTLAQITGTTSVDASPVTYSDTSAKTQDLADVVAAFKSGSEELTYTVASKGSEIASASMDGSQLTFNLANGLTDAGTAAIMVEVSGFTNYSKVAVTVNIELTDKTTVTVDMSDIVLDNRDFNGEALTYSGAAKAEGYDGAFTYTWQDAEGNELTEAPVDAGTYRLAASVSDTVFYAGSNYVTVTIAPKEVTVTALDKSAYVGSAVPDLSAPVAGKDYTISGLVDDTVVTVTLSCTPDMGKAGEYAITPSASEESGNYTFTCVNGKLTVSYLPVYSDPTYTPTVDDTTGGDTTVSDKSPEKGDRVTITTDPDKGYEVGEITVTDSRGNEVEVIDNGDGTFTYVQPTGKVTITVTYVPQEADFTDVHKSDYYYNAVNWAVAEGITYGITATTFVPDMICTRAQAVTFLWRAAGSPEPKSTQMPFTDVATGSYYYDAVLWAVENAITNGTSDTTFSPDMECTRAQIVTFLWRAQGKPAAETVSSFADVAADAYYAEAVLWAVENGVTNGTGSNTFSPDAKCTRAQIVTFLYRCMAE